MTYTLDQSQGVDRDVLASLLRACAARLIYECIIYIKCTTLYKVQTFLRNLVQQKYFWKIF